jgi:flagellar protein FliO/FliZ
VAALSAALLAALVLWPVPALAVEGYEPSLLVAVIKMFAALAVCLGVLIGGVHLLRRFNLVDQGRGETMIKVVATRALGPKRYVSVVEVGGLLLVLGVAEGGISLLTRLPGAEGGLREPGQAGLPRGCGCAVPEEFLG